MGVDPVSSAPRGGHSRRRSKPDGPLPGFEKSEPLTDHAIDGSIGQPDEAQQGRGKLAIEAIAILAVLAICYLNSARILFG